MKILNIVVLYTKSTTAAAYLALLKKNGYIPKKVIELEVKKGRKYHLLKRFMRYRIAKHLFFLKRKSNTQKENIAYSIADIVMASLPLSASELRIRPEKFCHEYESIAVDNLDDPQLKKLLSKQECKTFLFTGGGILKEELLSIENSRFIHIHPGIVPDVKGADGLYWSILLRGKPGYSCFYMNSGIDTGDILYQEEFSLPIFDKKIRQYSYSEIYRILLDYYDPVLRAITLFNLIEASSVDNVDLHHIPSKKQDPSAGRTFFFMHEKLRKRLIDKMIPR